MTNLPPPPETQTENVFDTLHGIEVVDPYRWLGGSSSQKTQSWLDGQSQYTRLALSLITGREAIKRLCP